MEAHLPHQTQEQQQRVVELRASSALTQAEFYPRENIRRAIIWLSEMGGVNISGGDSNLGEGESRTNISLQFDAPNSSTVGIENLAFDESGRLCKYRKQCHWIGLGAMSIVFHTLICPSALAQGLVEPSIKELQKEEEQQRQIMRRHKKSSIDYLQGVSKLGSVLQMEHKHSSVKSLYNQVLYGERPPKDPASRRLWADISLDAGRVYESTDISVAEKYFLSSATIYQQLDGLDSELMLEALLGYGRVLRKQHKYPQSIEALTKGINIVAVTRPIPHIAADFLPELYSALKSQKLEKDIESLARRAIDEILPNAKDRKFLGMNMGEIIEDLEQNVKALKAQRKLLDAISKQALVIRYYKLVEFQDTLQSAYIVQGDLCRQATLYGQAANYYELALSGDSKTRLWLEEKIAPALDAVNKKISTESLTKRTK
jgi:tetratricopeptide (TPR) repeat protein